MPRTTPGVSGCTYSVTGWRLGWVLVPATISATVRKTRDFPTVGAAMKAGSPIE